MREFFAHRLVLEVDTPLLGEGVVVEAHIDPVVCGLASGETRYLLTSPEGPMKRLLAAGSGPIFQFAHAFRDGEAGRRHRAEFCMLEWYRPGIELVALIDEVEALVRVLLGDRVDRAAFERWSYRDLFVDRVGVDPFGASPAALRACLESHDVVVPEGDRARGHSTDDLLDLLMVQRIEPTLGAGSSPLRGAFVHGYPPTQAALAQVAVGSDGVEAAERFELYLGGVELANGYLELADPVEQRRRFDEANRTREAMGRPRLPVDEALLDGLASMPPCSGVALGFDRLVMLAAGVDDIGDVMLP